ncbi:hypothetical protein ABW21_db0201855 [Orbilia brochopaga]|nr:hypothetical protein ABW21_db0201855 [Drechslerella brochopaga]
MSSHPTLRSSARKPAPAVSPQPSNLKTVEEVQDEIHRRAVRIGWARRNAAPETKRRTKAYSGEGRSKCFICDEALFLYESVELACGHRHCNDCIKRNYETVLNTPECYPPRCCQPLNIKQTIFVLSEDQIEAITAIKAKHDSKKLVTCAHCNEDLGDAETSITDDAAYCQNCEKLTCVKCKKAMHKGLCFESGLKKLAKYARGKQMAMCPKCGSVISKDGGCNTILCRCGSRFCYRCGHNCGEFGAGCKCIHGVRAKVEFATAMDDATRPNDAPAYRALLSKHKKDATRKQKSLQRYQNTLLTAQRKKVEVLKDAVKITELREQLHKLKLHKMAEDLLRDKKKSGKVRVARPKVKTVRARIPKRKTARATIPIRKTVTETPEKPRIPVKKKVTEAPARMSTRSQKRKRDA